ncbi:MAG: zinc metallopeptidase [Eggerthellaceae bacterium]|jgi:Zn-dependent membrane protease YugP|nr:zinc metallopeptidase [Eggerthellaceae bacterium]MDR2721366.1 zinc metallopeptidase [Coriobacteriaceae bacterium]
MFQDFGYLLFIVASLAIGGFSSWYVNHQLKKYGKVPASNGLTGLEAAVGMLSYYGIHNVGVSEGQEGQDHYDPRTRSIALSPSVFRERSITAIATACHEVGHACQHAQDYTPMKIRSAIVPVVNLASNAWMFILMIGIMLNFLGLINLAIIMYACVLFFQLVTLPVEFNASSRAMKYMKTVGVPQQDLGGAGSVLRACAFTYLAAALISVLQLLWLLSQRR